MPLAEKRQTDRQTTSHPASQTDRQSDRQRERDGQRDSEIEREMDRYVQRQTETDREIQRGKERKRDRETKSREKEEQRRKRSALNKVDVAVIVVGQGKSSWERIAILKKRLPGILERRAPCCDTSAREGRGMVGRYVRSCLVLHAGPPFYVLRVRFWSPSCPCLTCARSMRLCSHQD